jgi:hypothetical protein
LEGPDANARIRAAQALLQHMLRAAEVADLNDRVAEIEKTLEALEHDSETPAT